MVRGPITSVFLEVLKILKRYVYFRDSSYYLILSLYILFTYTFKQFDSLPYVLVTGPFGSGKTLILQILKLLCYRALPATSISPAAFYHVINSLNGTLLIDEVEEFSRKIPRGFDMAVVLNGYKKAGFVVRVDPRKRKAIKYKCYGPKVIANTGGIYLKPLLSRCIVIKTVYSEQKLERFLVSRDGAALKNLAKEIASLFQRSKIQEKIKGLYHNFVSIEGLTGRDEELWIGLLVLALVVDSESPDLKVFDRLTKIALAYVEKRHEDSFFLDWTVRVLISVANYVETNSYDGSTFIQADKLTSHVIKDIKPSFPVRTETISRLLDKESLMTERKLLWFRDEKGNPLHRTGWQINVKRLKNRVAKFQKYMEVHDEITTDIQGENTKEGSQEAPTNGILSPSDLADIFAAEYKPKR
jgi:hypothetical protein